MKYYLFCHQGGSGTVLTMCLIGAISPPDSTVLE